MRQKKGAINNSHKPEPLPKMLFSDYSRVRIARYRKGRVIVMTEEGSGLIED